MQKCEYCRKELDSTFQCSFCHKHFCNEHRLAHKHFCIGISKQDLVSKVIKKATLSQTILGSLLFVARMFIFALIMAVTVLAVDAVALLLLNLWNLHTWLNLLWMEGVIMAFLGGTAGLYHQKAPVFWTTPLGTRLYRIKWAVRKPLFWASFGIAGLMLVFSGLYPYFSGLVVQSGTPIHITADGSVVTFSPVFKRPISTTLIERHGNVYTLTSNINTSIIVEKDNIIIDGAGYILQGTWSMQHRVWEIGITLKNRSNVTIRNMEIKAFYRGIYLSRSSNIRIHRNNITNNSYGIWLWFSSNITICDNNFINNQRNVDGG